jgi:DNA topoisomerase II
MAESDSDCYMMQDDESSDFYDSSENEENVAPKKKVVTKKATAKPKVVKKKTPPDGDSEGAVAPLKSNSAVSKTKAKDKTIEELYQKKSQIEHILIRPDTYGTQFGFVRNSASTRIR